MSDEATKEFYEKVVLVTGASSGIGATTAVHFSALGATVVLTGRNFENLQKVGALCTTKPLLIKADMNNEEDVQNIINITISAFGKLDVLINNAGIFGMASIETANLEQYDSIFNTNVRAVYHLTTLAVPYLIASKGNIVNVSSLAGLRPLPGLLTYSMSKSTLDQFTKVISLELAPKQVRVNSVNPGVIVTDIFSRAGMSSEEVEGFLAKSEELHPLQRIGQPEEVAQLIAFLASDKAGFITGAIVPIDGGRQNVSPM